MAISLIPFPASHEPRPGFFEINTQTNILFSPKVKWAADLIQETILAEADILLSQAVISKNTIEKNTIVLLLDEKNTSVKDSESYRLDISEEKVIISGSDQSGLFYGIQTFKQLILINNQQNTKIKQPGTKLFCLRIKDLPKFSWRGLHLDVSRHFFPVVYIKKFLDVMAFYKFNIFHMHLTDDQGWRIEIKKYPLLAQVGSNRASTPLHDNKNISDQVLYGGYYSQNDIRDIVSYANDRYITVVPEIEMPGHALAALAAYPEYGCLGEGYEVAEKWGMMEDVFCPGNESLYPFLENILDEVMQLFPGEYIHIGGDECPKIRWKTCKQCQEKIALEELSNEDELQSYFIKRVGGFINEAGRRYIGWDEISEGGLAPGALVMSWRGIDGGIEAAKSGHDVIMSPNTHCYFDHYQSTNRAAEPPAIGGYIPLSKVYEFDPNEGVGVDKTQHVLGGQGNIWTEYIPDGSQVEYMAFPRSIALAERLWTGDGLKYNDFLSRLQDQIMILDRLGVNYRPIDR